MTIKSPRDVGELLAWAARPTRTPAGDEEYERVVHRYLNEPEFTGLADAVLVGAGLRIVVDEHDGVTVTADVTSPLRYTTADVARRGGDQQRAVIGAVLLAVARVAYPDPATVDDPARRPVFTTQNVVDALDRAARSLEEDADADADVDAAAVEVWRRWLELAEARPNAKRRSGKDRGGVVNKVCTFLADTGNLQRVGDTDGGTWKVRARFRHAVASLGEDTHLFRLVNGLAAAEESGATGDVRVAPGGSTPGGTTTDGTGMDGSDPDGSDPDGDDA